MVERARDHLVPGDPCYYADECNLRWLPTLREVEPQGAAGAAPNPGPAAPALREWGGD